MRGTQEAKTSKFLFAPVELFLTLTSQIYPLSLFPGSGPTFQHSFTKLSLTSFLIFALNFLSDPAASL